MDYFLKEDFLLQTEPARQLYHDYAKSCAIIDYHCHLPPQAIADNTPFLNLTDIWLRGDHYKWRAMRAFGIDEKFITGSATDEEKFQRWAAMVPYTVRNPLYHWTHMELKNPFGFEKYLSADTATEAYQHCTELLQQSDFSPRGLLQHFKVEVVVTTDDPCDDLRFHTQLAADAFPVKMLPCFRPDKVLQLSGGDNFRNYIRQLSEVSGVNIHSLDTLLEALAARVDYFHACGARLSDHGLNNMPPCDRHPGELDIAFRRVLGGNDNDAADWGEAYAGFVLLELCKLYHEKGWAQQFHIGAIRNNNGRLLNTLGPDTGFDSIGDYTHGQNLSGFLDQLDSTNQLARTILYNLNPADNELFATMTGNFNDGTIRGKMQYGSGWWFLDQKDGMEKQMNALSNMGLLSCFVGMVTDSRSFLSYSRHEYFRRVLCNLLGNDISNGLLPNDIPWLGKIVQDICYHNAASYFSFDAVSSTR